jgi:hypothetical protein
MVVSGTYSRGLLAAGAWCVLCVFVFSGCAKRVDTEATMAAYNPSYAYPSAAFAQPIAGVVPARHGPANFHLE